MTEYQVKSYGMGFLLQSGETVIRNSREWRTFPTWQEAIDRALRIEQAKPDRGPYRIYY